MKQKALRLIKGTEHPEEFNPLTRKQEAIKKFISQYLRGRFTTTEMPEDECDREAEFIVQYLHSQRCRIEVDRELPLQVACEKCHGIFDLSNEGLNNAGYVAFEPLIKEVTTHN